MIVWREANVTMAAVETDEDLRLSAAGDWAANARYPYAVALFRRLLALRRDRNPPAGARSLYLFQYDDYAQKNVRSIGFGRIAGEAPFVELIPDPYFLWSRGFQELRTLAVEDRLPDWSERADTLFWRGSGTHNLQNSADQWIVDLRDIPRVQLALRLRDHAHADIGLTAAWKDQPPEPTLAFYRQERIFGAAISMHEHANYRFQIDIDGVGNAWATLQRFLCGSCVLKVETPFEMWFYPRMQAWRHYVPVRADMEDLEERLDWCLTHPHEARAIGEAAQQLALSITFEAAEDGAVAAVSACRIPLD